MKIEADTKAMPLLANDPTKYIMPPYKFRGYSFQGYTENIAQMGIDMSANIEQLRLNVDGLHAKRFNISTKERPILNPRTNNSEPGFLYFLKPEGVTVRRELLKERQQKDLDPDSALVKRGEYRTRREQERQVLRNYAEDPTRPRYSAGRSIHPLVRIDEKDATLTCRGIIWDVIDEIHDEPFPSDIEAAWQNATIFMVAVGASKKRASSHPSVMQRYPVIYQRMKAFWSTLMVGMEQPSDPGFVKFEDEFMKWLPELNSSWCMAAPPLTQLTCGLLELCEVEEVLFDMGQRHASSQVGIEFSFWTTTFDDAEPKRIGARCRDSTQEFSSIPHDWTSAEVSYYREQFDHLGSLWHNQPYDLYHRPFSLLNVVPDPYWSFRREHDELAKCKARKFRAMPMMAPGNASDNMDIPEFHYYSHKQSFEEKLKSTVSMNPKGTLGIGLEKYALGRRFLITKKGYFGLGPREVRKGDRVAVIFGQDVPIILRRSSEAGRPGWEAVGEAYIQDIM